LTKIGLNCNGKLEWQLVLSTNKNQCAGLKAEISPVRHDDQFC